MQYRVVQKRFVYEGCPIVVRHWGEYFEYITCVNNEIYSSYVMARKNIIRRFLFLGYTEKEMRDSTNYVLAMAQATINSVLQINPETQQAPQSV